MTAPLPPSLAEISEDFLALGGNDRVQLLLEFALELPELPERYSGHPELLERVEECQSPVYIFVEVDAENIVHIFATAPEQAPTTRGFASILATGLSGLDAQTVLDVTDDFPQLLGLAEIISPLRMRGMGGMLFRIKRQVREKAKQT
jgi:cysteine desulfuration protein SufE